MCIAENGWMGGRGEGMCLDVSVHAREAYFVIDVMYGRIKERLVV